MRSLGVRHYVLLGLLAWGLPGVLISGSSALLVTTCAAMPVWLLTRRPTSPIRQAPNVRQEVLVAVLMLTLMYLLLDGLIGRQKLAANMFLSPTAVEDFVSQADDTLSQGRGVIDLLGTMMIVLPFALIDTARRTHKALRVAMFSIAVLYVFYDVGISRGYLVMAVLSVTLGTAMTTRKIVWSGGLALAAFATASAVRGDFKDVAFANPLFDAVAWPYINLALMLAGDCGNANWIDFVTEFAKKFLPAFVYSKEIFSFNIEMTRCIYYSHGDAIGSISIFTWLGEMYYYRPIVLTSIAAGALLAILCRFVDAQLERMQLHSLRVFSGLMCIVLLRSRVQDVFSFLILLWIFLIFWRLLIHPQLNYWSRWPRMRGRLQQD